MRELLEDMRREALAEGIPVMEDDGLEFLKQFISEKGIVRMLEVGTAIGYSAISFCLDNPELRIDTLEIDELRCQRALENIRKAGMEDRIHVHLTDARRYQCEDSYQLILLDGPKAHNGELLRRFQNNLEEGGFFVIDDVYFHGFIKNREAIRTRRLRTLVRKFDEFQKELRSDPEYECTDINIGDGLLIAERRRKHE